MVFPKNEKYKLQCEWGQCRETHEDMDDFYKHLDQHFWTDIANVPMESGLVCQWSECNFVTANGHDLIRHLYFHGFHTKLKWLGFLKHEEVKTGECQINQNRNIIPELPDGFKCCWEDCFIVVDIPDKYYDHVREHAVSADPETLSNGKKGFKCHWEGCGYQYAFESKAVSLGRHKLRGHMTTHTQERCYACPWCGNLYVNKTKLIDHFTRQINVENHSFQCTHCSRTFASERILKDHMRHHVNHYQCPKCAMTSPNPSALKHHIRYKHSTERPYACEFCEYRSKEPHDLQTHMQFHQSDLSYHCQVADCDYVVRSIQNLRYHYRVKHGSGDGKYYACHLCDKKYGTGYQLTHHLRKVHNFQWPPGHCRFRYKECEDGMFRLQIFRYESIELTTQMNLETATTDAETESTNECSTSAHIRPSSTKIVPRMNVERKKKGAVTRRNPIHPSRNVMKIQRNVFKNATVGTRKSARRTRQTRKDTKITSSKRKDETSAQENVGTSEDLNPDLPDLYMNTECLQAADTLCAMKTNSAKKRKTNNSKGPTDTTEQNAGHSSLSNGDGVVSHEHENPSTSRVTTRGSSGKKSSPPRGRLLKAKKRLLMTSKNISPKKICTSRNGYIKECSVNLLPLETPIFPNHHTLYRTTVFSQSASEKQRMEKSQGAEIPRSLVIKSGENELQMVGSLGREVVAPLALSTAEDSLYPGCSNEQMTTRPPPALLFTEKQSTVSQIVYPNDPKRSSISLQQSPTKQISTLQTPPSEFDNVTSVPNEVTNFPSFKSECESTSKAQKSDDGKMIEVNSSEIVTDEDGFRTVITVGGEEYYLVSGTDTETGSKVYCLVEMSEFTEEK